jgi:hypothetical protein
MVVTYRRVKWDIDSFAPYKVRVDGIFPGLFQEVHEAVIQYLVRIFRTCVILALFQPYCERLRYCLYLSPVGTPIADVHIVDLPVSHRFFLNHEEAS